MSQAFKVASVVGWWVTLPQGFFYCLEGKLLKDKVIGTACKHAGQNISFKWSSSVGILRKWKPFRKLAINLSGRATLQPPQALGQSSFPSSVSLSDSSVLIKWKQGFWNWNDALCVAFTQVLLCKPLRALWWPCISRTSYLLTRYSWPLVPVEGMGQQIQLKWKGSDFHDWELQISSDRKSQGT